MKWRNTYEPDIRPVNSDASRPTSSRATGSVNSHPNTEATPQKNAYRRTNQQLESGMTLEHLEIPVKLITTVT